MKCTHSPDGHKPFCDTLEDCDMTAAQPTARPWSVDAMGYIRGPEGENILEVKENAEFVCRAVNREDLWDDVLNGIGLAIEAMGNDPMCQQTVKHLKGLIARAHARRLNGLPKDKQP